MSLDGSSSFTGRRPKYRQQTKGADPRTEHGEKMCFSVVGSLLPVLAGRGPSCFGSLVRFPGPVVLPGSFLFGRRPKYRSFLSILWPRASCSSSRRERRRAKRKGTDPSSGPFWVSLYERRARFKREVRLHAYVGLVVFFALFSLFLFFFVLVCRFSLSEVEPPRSYPFGAEHGLTV